MMLNTQYMPVPKNIRRKKKLMDNELPSSSTASSFFDAADQLQSSPVQFIASAAPTVLQGIPSIFRTNTNSPFVVMDRERQRADATLRTMQDQQNLLNDELNISRISTIDSMAKFLSTYSDKIAPEVKAQFFGRTRNVPTSVIKTSMRGKSKEEKREMLEGLIVRHDLSDNYRAFHEVERETRRIKDDVANRMSLQASRSRTTRTTDERLNVPIVSVSDPMREYLQQGNDAIDRMNARLASVEMGDDEPFGELRTTE